MSDLHFLRPWWLVAVFVALVVTMILSRTSQSDQNGKNIIESKLANVLMMDRHSKWHFSLNFWLGVTLTCGCLALAGPSWNKQVPDELNQQADIVVIMANSNSMYAGDVTPNRNRAVKNKINQLRHALPQSRFALIAYADTAHLVIPLTQDSGFFNTFLPSLDPSVMPNKTLATSGLAQALALAKQSVSQSKLPANFVLFVDQMDSRDQQILSQFHQQFPSLEVMVVGSKQGAALRFAPASVSSHKTQLEMANFMQLKQQGVATLSLSQADADQDILWLKQNIQSQLSKAHNQDAQWHWQDSGYWLVLLMLLFSLVIFRRIILVNLSILLLVGMSGLYSQPTQAQEPLNPQSGAVDLNDSSNSASDSSDGLHAKWQSLWWSHDQLGQKALDKGLYQQAAQDFDDPYRKGRAFYLAKQFDQAADAFMQVPTAEGYFYLANSLAQQQQFQAALSYYQKAISARKQQQQGFPQAVTNAKNMRLVLTELAKKKGTKTNDKTNMKDFSSIKINLNNVKQEKQAQKGVNRMSDQEVKSWLDNTDTSPQLMMKTLFILQAQQRVSQPIDVQSSLSTNKQQD